MSPQILATAGNLGDIFWDLAPSIVYSPGFDLGCQIYVANPTDTEKEYALIARLSRDTVVLSEEALPVFGYTWFKVDPGDFITLKGSLRFAESNAELAVSLIERETEEITDTVATILIAPTTASLPPAWPGTSTATTTTDSMSLMAPLLMMATLGMVIVSTSKNEEQDRELTAK
jgi:hypothetical protein